MVPALALMRLWTLFTVAPDTSREQLIEFCNRINYDLVIVRAAGAAGPPPFLVLDHYLLTQAGVTGRQVVGQTRRFCSALDAIGPLDTDKLLG